MKKEKTNLVKEFKEFIAKGNFIDMAVGIVVGGAFTSIVNATVTNVITPLINAIIYYLCGGNTDVFSGLDIILIPAKYDELGNLISNAYVLGFSSLISSILNFFITAFVLFSILKFVNKVRSEAEEVKEKTISKIKKENKKEENTVEEEGK